MKKIAVIGCGGAGKSTFSCKLSEVLHIPVYHLDKLNWKPGWVPTPKEEFDATMKTLVSQKEWIIDGNYGRTLDLRLKSADTIVFLNMPRYQCVYRIVKRRWMYHGKPRPDVSEGCPEQLDLDFVRWVWGYDKNQKPRIIETLKRLSNEKKVIILNHSSEVDKFLCDLKNH